MPDHTEEYLAQLRQEYPVAFELFYAVHWGTPDDVLERLRAGDDPNARSADGTTPIRLVTQFNRDIPKADLLFNAGARLDSWDHLGMQPIHWATHRFDTQEVRCLAWLLDRGADPNARVRPSIEHQFHPIGWTPLHIAAAYSSIDATQLLISRHAELNASAADGSTALHVAARQYRVYKKLIRMLVNAGANINAVDCAGNSPLHVLAVGTSRYRKTAIQFLKFRNARLDLRNASGRLPVDLVPDGYPASEAIRQLLKVPDVPKIG